MKNTIKSILALALVACCGMAQADTGTVSSWSVGSNVSATKTQDGNPYTIGVTALQYSGSNTHNLQPNGAAWYAGIEITWVHSSDFKGRSTPISFSDNTGRTVSEYNASASKKGGDNSPAGSGIALTTDWKSIYQDCIKSTSFWTYITPEKMYELFKAGKNYRGTMLMGGKTFNIDIPNTITMTGGGHAWYPAEILVGDKVYGEVPYALQQTGTIKFIKNTDTTCDFSTDGRTFDLNNKTWAIKGGTITGSGFTLSNGKPVVSGGTFSFDPKAYLALGYEAEKSGDVWIVKQGHVHSWSFVANGDTLTATCSGEGTCPVEGKVATLTVNFSDGKTYDGQTLADSTLTEETHSTLSFAEATGATIAGPSYTGDRTSAGDHTATWTITDATSAEYKISKTANIAQKNISDATITLSANSLYYTAADQTVTISSVKIGGLDVTYAEATDSVRTAKAIDTHTVKISGTGNFTGTATKNWYIVNTTGAIKSQEVVDGGITHVSGNDYTLNPENSANLEYDVTKQIWTAAIKITFPHSDYDWPKLGTPGGASYVKASTAFITYQGEQFTAQSIIGGEERAKGSGSVTKGASVISAEKMDDSYYFAIGDSRTYYYLDTITWRVSITPDMIKAALAEQKTALVYTINVGSIIWATPDDSARTAEGNATGTAFQDYTITIPISESYPKLFDKYNQVYPALPYVAQVDGEKKYLTLDEALGKAGSGQTVNAIATCEAEEFNVGKNVIVNLGGYGAAGASYVLNADNDSMGAKVTSTKAETVSAVSGFVAVLDTTSGYVYTVEHAHVHHWVPTLEGARLTITCDESGCKVPGCTTNVELKVTDNRDSNEPTRWIENQAAFLGIVNEFKTVATIGDINIVRMQGDNADLSRWYVGSYRATCVVTLDGVEHTLVNDFKITKPDGGYAKNGWVVGSSDIRYDDDDSEKAIAATETTDTIYYRGPDRDYENHKFSIGEGTTLTFDFNGKTLTKSAYKTMTIENNGKGVLVLQNVVIRQPRATYTSGQISTYGAIAFGTGVKVVNTADDSSNYCTITVKSGTLLITDGLYQCGLDGNALVTGGKFWANDDPTDFVYDKGNTYVVRTIDETIESKKYTRQVVAHTHHDAYFAAGNVITATCDAQDHEYCSYGSPTATLNAEDRKETGSAYAGASITYSGRFPITNTVDDIVYYTKVDEESVKLTYVPSLFGTYTATLKVGDVTAEKGFAITLDKDDPEKKNEIPYVPKGSAEPIAINVSSQFIADNIDTTGKSTTDIMAELNADGANGIPKVESYVLGLDPKVATSVPVAQPVQTSDAAKLTLTVGGIDVKEDAGAKVMYSVVTANTPEGLKEATPGEKQDSPTFELDLPANGVKYYGIKLDLVNP